MENIRQVKTINGTVVEEPKLARFLFSDVRMAAVWLVLRLWLGWQWLTAGWDKVGAEGWTGGGAALQGYWERAVAVPDEGRPAIAVGWYRDFLEFLLQTESYTWFAPLVAWGEVLVGVGLIVGAFVGIAAFFGALMNWSFIMAGTASTNALLLLVAIVLMLAWKTAGWYGLDRWLLPYIGTPWTRMAEVKKGKGGGKASSPA